MMWAHIALRKCKLLKQYVGALQLRHISCTTTIHKRRKTADERKAVKLVEYSPKKLNNTSSLGTVGIWRNITIAELADLLDKDLEEIQELLLYLNASNKIDPALQLENIQTIREVVTKCGLKCKIVAAPQDDEVFEMKDRDVFPRPPALPENLEFRPPVVTVMGHVDHGKTTLLDSLRGASVAAGEAGGITQHIGAFTVTLDTEEKVTFLDTPGHAAFAAMRARGAHLTDIVVLVVAADDGVMTQTQEVIKLAQDAGVPIIVAVNKIDKPEADIERTKISLVQQGLPLEGYGGDVQVVEISALHGTNLNKLIDAISTQATLMDLKSEFSGYVEGVVVESRTDTKRGKLSTAIITRGTLRKTNVIVSGLAWAKVRGLFDDQGKIVDFVTPGSPVEILGWRELPLAGDIILEVESEKKAHSVLRWRHVESLKEKAGKDLEVISIKEHEHYEQYKAARDARRLSGRYKVRRQGPRSKEFEPEDKTPRVNIILKGDVHGSVEALLDVFDTYASYDKCRLDVVHYGVGDITEGDMQLAKTFNAIIYAFDVNSPSQVQSDVTVKKFNIIYKLIDDLKEEISCKLPPVEVEEILGEANVLQTFLIADGKKQIPVAGCRCIKGFLKKNSRFRITRNEEILYDGEVDSMRHLKNEVDTIRNDVECGLRFKDNSIVPQAGDTIVCYSTRLETQKTDWDPGF